jgi:hypothetical protein
MYPTTQYADACIERRVKIVGNSGEDVADYLRVGMKRLTGSALEPFCSYGMPDHHDLIFHRHRRLSEES